VITYALFVTFFPQLVAGPIERTANLLPQFYTDNTFDYQRITDGLRLAAWGMFKKVVVADTVAQYVNAVYSNPQDYTAVVLVIATFFFAIQIFCDFSGYSDIAIGVARILGFRLMKNFRSPYFSASITEFWRRWHISLSSWLKDYVYIPLGGSKRGTIRNYTLGFMARCFLEFRFLGITSRCISDNRKSNAAGQGFLSDQTGTYKAGYCC